MNLVFKVNENTKNFWATKSKSERKKIGQFFTDDQTALFMAGMFDFTNAPKKIRVLDPGAGTGILSAAFIEVAKKNKVKEIELVLIENNDDVLPVLEENIQLFSRVKGIKISITLKKENFIIEQSVEFSMNLETIYGKFDYIICNPPYLKIPRNAEETLGMDLVILGAPNLYFLFMALGAHDLASKGQMVFIIPRSWTSGAYFKKFREYLFDSVRLDRVHLFSSRDKVFSIEKVLQETVIVKFSKEAVQNSNNVILTTSRDNNFLDIQELSASYDTIIRGNNRYVFLPTTTEQVDLLQKIDTFENTLPQLGLKLKTGLTVDFKNKDRLMKSEDDGTVPLIFSSNFYKGRIVFPNLKEEYQYVVATNGMKQENKDYLFLKRLTSKEEVRRLQPAIYLKEDIDTEEISTDNKLNFIERLDKKPIDREIIYGLYVIFSSGFYDEYYRILNGSTQVNATEINDMPIPDEEGLKKLGRQFEICQDYSQQIGDKLIESLVGSYV